ncbi:hypothetical protein [Bosea sp. R86505]|uniref:hypothetical protein n=1 Tax=Bosea sp. R86505 TaxID=3101710 RepID=UPI00366D607A
MNANLSGAGRPNRGLPPRDPQAYVIEIGETQAGLVSRRGEERFFTFIAASPVFHAIEGHRFATPDAAERAARQLASLRRRPNQIPS